MKTHSLAGVLVLTLLFGLFGCAKNAERTVDSVEMMTLTLHGMRGSYVYRLEGDGEQTVLCRYREAYSSEQTELLLEESVPCSRQTMAQLMNSCKIMLWDGFHGAHPKNVSDGIMFRFEATVNGGESITADGSANFPNGYYDFVRTLDKMLSKDPALGLEANSPGNEPLSASEIWKCPECSGENSGAFCSECGQPKK